MAVGTCALAADDERWLGRSLGMLGPCAGGLGDCARVRVVVSHARKKALRRDV